MSTAFSGIDAPGTGGAMLANAISEQLLGRPCPRKLFMKHKSAVEWNKAAASELLGHPHPPEHLFTDMNGFLTPWAKGKIQQLTDVGQPLTMDTLWFIVANPHRSVTPVGKCSVCNSKCAYHAGSIHWAGTPCVDFSPMGKGQGCEGGAILCFMSWAALMLLLLPPMIVHENSHRFLVDVLHRIFGKYYNIDSSIQCASVFGNPISRQRRWSILSLRGSVRKIGDVAMTSVMACLARDCTSDFSCYMVAKQEDFNEELAWASSRPTSIAAGTSVDELNVGPHSVNFWDGLTKSEASYLEGYIDLPGGLHKIHNLGQNPKSMPLSSQTLCSVGGGGAMMALIKSQDMLWDTPDGRWVHPFEMLAMQGFPVFSCMPGFASQCCSFDPAGIVQTRSRNSITSEAGNSMHVSVVAAMWVYVTLFFERDNADEHCMSEWLSNNDLLIHGEPL
jgi:site-specific DNA-cytosine methylase